MALGATVPFARTSCGFVGTSDGWTDLRANFEMDWEFDTASDGNVALTGEVDLGTTKEFTLGVAFGDTEHNAIATLVQSLYLPFDDQLATFKAQWQQASARMADLASHSHAAGWTVTLCDRINTFVSVARQCSGIATGKFR